MAAMKQVADGREITLSAWSERSGVSRPQLSKALAGTKGLRMTELLRLADALDLRLSTIIATVEAQLNQSGDGDQGDS
ncbi:helix-turn-helix domain-containing protein [Propionibacterium freudenreichii]|nr:helix-turn-helix domain-containing protein [Propionibacterium freudenreichii]